MSANAQNAAANEDLLNDLADLILPLGTRRYPLVETLPRAVHVLLEKEKILTELRYKAVEDANADLFSRLDEHEIERGILVEIFGKLANHIFKPGSAADDMVNAGELMRAVASELQIVVPLRKGLSLAALEASALPHEIIADEIRVNSSVRAAQDFITPMAIQCVREAMIRILSRRGYKR